MTNTDFNHAIYKASKTLKPYAVRLTKDYEEANDLLQDTLVKALLNREKYATGTNLKAWLYTIMKNTFITNYQRMARQNTFVDSTENLHYLNSFENTVDNTAYSLLMQEDINKALNNLEESFSKPFMMYFKGFKYHEIAQKLDIPIGTVKNRIHIARKELKEKLNMYQYSY